MKTIKLFLAILLIGTSSVAVKAQSADLLKLMDGLEGQKGVTSVLVSKKMFQLFTKTTDLEVDGQSLNEILMDLDQLKIIEVGNWQPAAKNLQSDINAILKKDKFETLMKVVEDGETIEISVMEKDDVIRHLVMFIQESSESAVQLISLSGRINLENISKLAGTLNIESLKHIDKK